jgi:putative addiction module component (TIGR02574 family)
VRVCWAQIPSRKADAAELEAELRAVKAEQKRLTKSVALSDDMPELVTELRERAPRARNLEVGIGNGWLGLARSPTCVGTSNVTVNRNEPRRFSAMRHASLDGIVDPMTRLEVFDAALALPAVDRGKLAEQLVASLDGDLDPDSESAWGAEIERRFARLDSGQATTLSMDDAVARLRRAAHGS